MEFRCYFFASISSAFHVILLAELGELQHDDAHAANSRIYGPHCGFAWDLPCQGCLPSAMTNSGAAKFLNQDHESTNHKPARVEELCQHDEAKRSVACRTLDLTSMGRGSHPGFAFGGQRPGSMAPPDVLEPRLWPFSNMSSEADTRISCHNWPFLHGGTLMARQLRCGPPGPRTGRISSNSPAPGAGPVHPLIPQPAIRQRYQC